MPSILIIEDDSAFSHMMEVILRMEGYEVRIANDGASGIFMLRDARPDLVLCDVVMPHMDGFDVMAVMKGDEALSDIPFIFVSYMADRNSVRSGMSKGADDYLPKPFSAEELLAAVGGRIQRHALLFKQHNKLAFTEELAVLQSKITNREREVLLMVGQGDTSSGIAKSLGITAKTVNVHRKSMMDKLGASNAATLARWAFIQELGNNQT
jgi:DNA-binding NarL/FixJ family response regulator